MGLLSFGKSLAPARLPLLGGEGGEMALQCACTA